MSSYPSSSPSSSSSSSSYISPIVPNLDIQTLSRAVKSETVVAFLLGSFITVGSLRIHSRYVRRIQSAEWVTAKMMKDKRWIKGVVTSVGDGDGFRLYHTPGLFWNWPIKLRHIPSDSKQLKNETIHIRMAGVDAPESAHFGKAAQPYSGEALTWLRDEIGGKRLWVQIIKRDQYNRIVGIPIRPPCLPFVSPPASRCVSIAMLSAGYARTYEQSGAEYGVWGKDVFLKHEAAARDAKRGMWASPVSLESPAEYKKRHRDAAAVVPETERESSFPAKRRTLRDMLLFWTRT